MLSKTERARAAANRFLSVLCDTCRERRQGECYQHALEVILDVMHAEREAALDESIDAVKDTEHTLMHRREHVRDGA